MRVLLARRVLVRFAWCLLVALSCAASGCVLSGADEESVSVRLQTDQTTYTTESAIALAVTNRGDAPIYRAGCPVIALQELQAGTLLNEWIVAGFEFCGGFFAIEAGASYRDTVNLGSELLRDRLSTARFDASVEYRLDVASLYRRKDSGDRLSEANRRSNRFKITQP